MGNWKVGDRALVQWSGDGDWYPASVTGVSDSQYYVIFDDGDEEWTNDARMTPENLTAGDKVLGNWKRGGEYYPGTISARAGNVLAIDYDDGDKETLTIARIKVRR